jgi:hypothetical protein
MTGSLAYRKNEDAILRGEVPDKYTRLLPFIPGERILEIGSAEGVLALLLARMGRQVTALEKSEERHESANRLYSEWLAREHHFNPPTFINGTINERLDVLAGVDTLVAVRMIYYLRDQLDTVFSEVAKHIPNVVLCGNRNRAERWRAGVPDDPGGPHNKYASRQGMVELLERHGYRIAQVVSEGDEIVVGERA